MTYTVQQGDSLYRIAQRFKASVEQLKNWNSLSSNTIKIGQKLRISPRNTPQEQNENASKNQVHVVRSGESLYSIARKYKTSVKALKTLNQLNSDFLHTGQELSIKKVQKETKPTQKKTAPKYE